MDRIHENLLGEILPYQFEPEPSTRTSDASDDNDTDQSDVTTSTYYPLRLLNVFVAKRRRWSTSTKCKTTRYKLHAVFVAYIVY